MPEVEWSDRYLLIYFVYGLAFFSLGLALIVESGRSSELGFARSMRLLAGFGFLHGTHEWLDLAALARERLYGETLSEALTWFKLAILITSFISLIAFGEHLLARERAKRLPSWFITGGIVVFYGLSAVLAPLIYQMTEVEWRQSLEALARYILSIPGAILACYALWQQRKTFIRQHMAAYANYLIWAILALFLYGLIGQAFPSSSPIFPASRVNSDRFLEIFGFPVQLLRTVLASILTISLIAVLRSLEFESQKRMEDMVLRQITAERHQAAEMARLNDELRAVAEERERLLEEVRKRDARRGELLLHITAAQESERQRIARELHDDTGQALTGLALGLRGISGLVKKQPDTAAQKIGDLEQMATSALTGLRHLINDLRPPQLDDMGLVAALRFMRERFSEFNGVPEIQIITKGDPCTLPKDVETALFRIAQEGVTNAIKHAEATHIMVELDYTGCVKLTIRDDGKGFDLDTVFDMHERTAWGIYGVQERANLINADLKITTARHEGTVLEIQLRDREPEGEML